MGLEKQSEKETKILFKPLSTAYQQSVQTVELCLEEQGFPKLKTPWGSTG